MKKHTIIFLFLNCCAVIAIANIPSSISNKYKNVPVLVTGGCGFIGSHLVEKLVSLGAHVTVLDDLSTGRKNNIAIVADTVTYIQGTIVDFDLCMRATQGKEIIFHVAAFISVPGSIDDPHVCHMVNVVGTHNILEAARINKVKRVVFSSSCAVYGESEVVCKETDVPLPISPYGFSKLIGELQCREYAHVFNMETVALRYFNVFGPRQSPYGQYAGVVAKFNYNMEHNLPIAIFGDGTQTRDFIPVEDVVHANIVFGACDKSKIQGEVFNIATGNSITLLTLIELLKQTYVNYTGDILFMPPRQGDVQHVSACCEKYIHLLSSAVL